MWARGSGIKGFQLKARLVPAGTAGQFQLPYAWSDNLVRSFSPSSAVTTRRMAVWTPSQDGNASWEVEVLMKYPRTLLRPAYKHKFRIGGVVTPGCE